MGLVGVCILTDENDRGPDEFTASEKVMLPLQEFKTMLEYRDRMYGKGMLNAGMLGLLYDRSYCDRNKLPSWLKDAYENAVRNAEKHELQPVVIIKQRSTRWDNAIVIVPMSYFKALSGYVQF